MKNNRTLGKLAVIASILAVLFSLLLMYSHADPGDPTGRLTKIIGSYIYTPSAQSVESTLQAVGTYDITEKNIQKLLTLLIAFSSLMSGALAVAASRKEQSSIWYSLAIALSSAALMKLSTPAAVLFMFVFGFICLRNRKWKMTRQ